jgi:lipid-A-disaccharide synthase
MAVVFPFEVDIFQAAGVPVTFVGHPLLDELNPPDMIADHPAGAPRLLALLPGSRRQEVMRHLPIMIQAAELLKRDHPDLEAAVGLAPTIEPEFYDPWIPSNHWIRREPDARRLLRGASLAAVCSGTATLEAALFKVPQVVVYRTSALNYQLARRLVRLKNIALVNVVAGRQLAPELLQSHLTPQRLADELRVFLSGAKDLDALREGYDDVRRRLGEPGAARRVAEIISGTPYQPQAQSAQKAASGDEARRHFGKIK